MPRVSLAKQTARRALAFPSTLDRYVFAQLSRTFMLALLVIVSLVLISRAAVATTLVLELGMSLGDFMRVVLYFLPNVLLVALGIAGTIAVLALAAQLRDAREYSVALAAGLSPWQVMRSIAVMALLSGLVGLLSSAWLIPAAHNDYRRIIESYQSDPSVEFRVRTGQLNPIRDNLLLYVKKIGEGNRLEGLHLSTSSEDGTPQVFWAEYAELQRDGDQLSLILHNGEQISLLRDSASQEVSPARLGFESQRFTLSQQSGVQVSPLDRASTAYSIPQLFDPAFHRDAGRARQLITEGHFRLAGPLFVMLFPFAAFLVVTAGLPSSRRAKNWRAFWVWALFLATLIMMLRLDVLGDEHLRLAWLFYPVALLPVLLAVVLRRITRPRYPAAGLS